MTEANLYKYLFQDEQLYVLANDPDLSKTQALVEGPKVEEVLETYKVSKSAESLTIKDIQLKSDILILIDTQSKGLGEAENTLITKIMQAVGYELDQLDVLDISQENGISMNALVKSRRISKLILFGITTTQIDISISMNLYTPQTVDGVLVVNSDSLSSIHVDVTKKRQLWAALQSIFK